MEISREGIEDIDDEMEAENMRKVEAALFISGRYLSVQELVALTDVNPILLKKLLEDLQNKYNKSGVEIINNNNSWKMDVSQDYSWMVNKMATGNSEFTKAEQETLAIIAYKQPMKQSVLVKIRGNKSYDHIKKFVEMNLIIKKKMGHTAELKLSENFYDYFSVVKGEELAAAVIGGDVSALNDAVTKAEKEVIEEENKNDKEEVSGLLRREGS